MVQWQPITQAALLVRVAQDCDVFKRWGYSAFGQIDDHWCNHDELETTLGYLMDALERGTDLVTMRRKAAPVGR
jgi:hypothetical protein